MPQASKRFRMGQRVLDSRTGLTYGIGWVNKDGVTVVSQDGKRTDVAWKDAYRYLTIT